MSQWLRAGLSAAGLPAVLLETRHVKAALSAMTVKIDRKDARGSLRAEVNALHREMLEIALQRMWGGGTDFRFGKEEAAA